MPQEIIFSERGIKLTIELEGESAAVLLTLKLGEENEITYYFNKKGLNAFQEQIQDACQYLGLLESAVARRKADGTKTGDVKLLKIIKRFLYKENIIRSKPESWPEYKLQDFLNASRASADVFIGLPQEQIDIFTIERIQNATGDFMEAMGFELETQDEPVYGSFFQKLKYILKTEVREEASEIYSKGKTALEAQFIDLPSAEATSKLASSAAELITALGPVSDAAIRCGSILLVKVTKDGVPKIITETISPELAALLNKNPALLQNPSIVFDLISGMRAPDKTIEESGSAELAE